LENERQTEVYRKKGVYQKQKQKQNLNLPFDIYTPITTSRSPFTPLENLHRNINNLNHAARILK
jgi:hypothetical protein